MTDKYGTTVKEVLVNEVSDSPKRISLVSHHGHFWLDIRSMWYDSSEALRFGKGIRLLIDDGTAKEVLQICEELIIRPEEPETLPLLNRLNREEGNDKSR